MNKRRFVITGINRLTKEREDISRPMPVLMAEKAFLKAKEKPSRNRPYIYLRMQEYPYREERLKFNGGG